MTVVACEDESTSYIYLIGIKPKRQITLGENLTLEPVSVSPNPDDMIDCIMRNGSKSEVDLGILIATLRFTTAQLVVRSDNAQELVTAVWNSQTDAVLLSALLNKEVYWSLQSNMSADAFCASTRVSVASPRQMLPRDVVDVSEEDCAWIEGCYGVAQSLMDDKRFYMATNALWSYQINPRPSTQLAVLWSGIESLFSVHYELNFRLILLISKLLGTGVDGQRKIKKLYEARSKAVHAGTVKDAGVVAETADVLHELILRCLEIGHVPDEQELLFSSDV